MSYSFNVRAANKADAKAAVAAKFDSVVSEQAVHARDREAAQAAAFAAIDLVVDDDTQDIGVSCNGYVACTDWSAQPDEVKLSAVSITASAGHVARQEAA